MLKINLKNDLKSFKFDQFNLYSLYYSGLKKFQIKYSRQIICLFQLFYLIKECILKFQNIVFHDFIIFNLNLLESNFDFVN